MEAQRVPGHDVGVLDRTVLVGPLRQTISFRGKRILAVGIQFIRATRGHPEMVAGEATSSAGELLSTQQ